MDKCRICDNTESHAYFKAKEMLHGFRDEFQYFECTKCGCVQIQEIPVDLARYYPHDYYSHQKARQGLGPRDRSFTTFLKRQRARCCISPQPLVRKIWSLTYNSKHRYVWYNKVHLRFNSKILDIGCGSGLALLKMYLEGFRDLSGVDPYIEKDICYENGVRIYKKEICQLEGEFDLIMSCASFEHTPDPLKIFQETSRLLKPNGYVRIGTPLADSFTWREYKEHWEEVDAPRHIFVPTVKGMNILAEKVNFSIVDIEYRSTEAQFILSEMYKRDIPYIPNENKSADDPTYFSFSKEKMQQFREKVQKLNEQRDGDFAYFYLKKK